MEKVYYQKETADLQSFIERTVFPDLSRLNHSYWFRLILTEEEVTTEIRYKVAVRFIKELTESSALISIDRMQDDVYINDRAPDLPVDMLAFETGKIFYPLEIEISERMKWLGIRNPAQIVQRWEAKQQDLRRYFQGEEAGRYLNRMGEKIASGSSLDKIFENELFMQVYFHNLYVADFNAEIPIAFSVGDYGDVSYKVKSIKNMAGKEGNKEVTQTGVEIQRQSETDAGSESKNTYTANYVLDAQTNHIKEMNAEWNRESPVKRKIRVILFPLRQSGSAGSLIKEEDVKQEKKKSFLSRLFGN